MLPLNMGDMLLPYIGVTLILKSLNPWCCNEAMGDSKRLSVDEREVTLGERQTEKLNKTKHQYGMWTSKLWCKN